MIIMWMSLGLVSVTLLFGHSMYFEYRSADNRLAEVQAKQAINGAARYLSYLANSAENKGDLPILEQVALEQVPIDEAWYWLLGRDLQDSGSALPTFGLVDETGKLNLNAVTTEVLEALPNMTPEFAAAIVDWRDEDSELSDYGAESETYLLMDPPYECKNAPFETVEELFLLSGASEELLLGEDTNRNGILDPNENDGDQSLPLDNRDGRLDTGLLEYFTVYSRESTLATDGEERVNVNDDNEGLEAVLSEILGSDRASEIGAAGGDFENMLDYYRASGMTADEFAKVDGELTVYEEPPFGLVNINTASRAVLAALPGIGEDNVDAVLGQRASLGGIQTSLAWITDVLDEADLAQLGEYITGNSYQLTADVVAVGRNGRGYRRESFVIDTSNELAEVRHRKDLSRLGWALGPAARLNLMQLLEEQSRRQ